MNIERPAGLWPGAIVGLIFFFLLLTGWSVHRAVTGVSAVSNPKYYTYGLKYNHTLVEKEAAAALGWHIETFLQGRHLSLRLRDGDGRDVSGVQALLTLFGTADNRGRTLELDETGPGYYATELPPDLPGQTPARLLLKREGAGMTRSLLLNP